jgi:hypothetical protein
LKREIGHKRFAKTLATRRMGPCVRRDDYLYLVIAGLDPAIHRLRRFFWMDARVILREDARSLSSGAHSRDPLALLPAHDD